jgi:peptide/nickel transport system permease protein
VTTLTRLVKNPLGSVGFFLVLFWVAIALFSPVISPPGNSRDPYMIARTSFSSIPRPPSEGAAFGTTSGGYDILYGIVWGSRTAFKVGLIVVGCSALIGIALGGFGAFCGGWVDDFVMRLTDLFMSFPFLIAVIVMSIVLGKGLEKVIIALILFGWRNYARVVRSEVLSIKEKEYVQAAISLGAGRLRIFVRHVLPNAVFPIFVLATIDIGTMVRIAAALSFLGVGAEPGYADWGQMINLSRQWLLGIVGDPFHYWYTYTFPGIAILTFVLGWTLLGDALRDILDPRLS